jgi:hypothetical protein
MNANTVTGTWRRSDRGNLFRIVHSRRQAVFQHDDGRYGWCVFNLETNGSDFSIARFDSEAVFGDFLPYLEAKT